LRHEDALDKISRHKAAVLIILSTIVLSGYAVRWIEMDQHHIALSDYIDFDTAGMLWRTGQGAELMVLPSHRASFADLLSRESGLEFRRVTPVPTSVETGRMR
jgi:hypothetical protein